MDANPKVEIGGLGELQTRSSYFIGKDSRKWIANVRRYRRVRYHKIYPGIDLEFYANDEGSIEYDFIVYPDGDPAQIKLLLRGSENLDLTEEGDLIGRTLTGQVRQKRPLIYQNVGEQDVIISGSYVLDKERRILGFEVGNYDRQAQLIIDPILIFSTYVGGSVFESIGGVAIDPNGHILVTGTTLSLDFPTIAARQDVKKAEEDAFLMKLNSQGSPVYSTYFGGARGDGAYAIAVDVSGNPYVVGRTISSDFPTVGSLQDKRIGDGDAYVIKFGKSGHTILFSSLLGGREEGQEKALGVALDGEGAVYITGVTDAADFPVMDAFQPNHGGQEDAFVTKMDRNGTLLYSTFLGGSGQDRAAGISVDQSGYVYIAGNTVSSDFPSQSAFQPSIRRKPTGNNKSIQQDAFLTKLNPSGGLVFSTYFGGNDEERALDMTIDSLGQPVLVGSTRSNNIPTMRAIQPQSSNPDDGTSTDAFITKFRSDGQGLVYSTYLGGELRETAWSVAIGANDEIIIVGTTGSKDFPLFSPIQKSIKGTIDGFITILDPGGKQFLFSSYLGGAALDAVKCVASDSVGRIAAAGVTHSTDFPIVQAFQQHSAGAADAFVVRLDPQHTDIPVLGRNVED